ncbi:hypothetical protein [Peribacillus huizhouensis]|uniref:Uncharacterized protein n=1 Tax=Peribacillus huizhouensis TaxID=1501239 RepID=A0ABR6CJT0_9BACI|nr:hypothetical protein [Peribacillus huizhouensis]MBA9025166.1 hypothetical protein [Peribacillus huizhouensis]
MKFNKYSLLFISFLAFISFGFFLFYKYLKAEEFLNIDSGLQSAYDVLNLQIIYNIYIPFIIIIHLLLVLIYKFKDKKSINK